LNELAVSRARMCTGSWFQALQTATANARVPKCVTEEETIHKVATSSGSESLSAADKCNYMRKCLAMGK